MMPMFSLRGKIDVTDKSRTVPIRIFDYVSPDRTRAWKVKQAHVWPITVRANTGSDEGKCTYQFALATDDGFDVAWNDLMDPTENRTFAWTTWNGYLRDDGSDDFIMAEVDALACFLIDPDTFVVKELWLAGNSTTESATAPVREWGYQIVLEEVKITPSQSVFQQIKGMGQDVV